MSPALLAMTLLTTSIGCNDKAEDTVEDNGPALGMILIDDDVTYAGAAYLILGGL